MVRFTEADLEWKFYRLYNQRLREQNLTGIYFAPTPAHKARLRAIIAPGELLVEQNLVSRLAIPYSQARLYERNVE